MSRLIGSLLPAALCAAAVAAASPARGQPAAPAKLPTPPTERVVMRLTYQGVPGCSDPEPFVLALTPRVHGWDPLSEAGRWRLVVTIKRRAQGFEGTAELHDPKGDVMWTRAFPPKARCSVLVERLAFAVAFRIDTGEQRALSLPAPAPVCPAAPPVPTSTTHAAKDPSACEDMLEVVPPLPVPPSTPTPPEPKTGLSFRLGAGVWIGQVTTDRAALGLTLDAGVRHGWFSAAIEGRADPPMAGALLPMGGSVNYGRATGALLLCMHYDWFVGCGKGEAGRLLLLGNVYPSTYGYGAAGLRLGLEFPVVPRHFFLRVAGELLEAVKPATITKGAVSVLQVAQTNAGIGLGAVFALDKP